MKLYPPEHHSFGVSARPRPLSHPFHVRDSPCTVTEPRYSSTKIKLGKQPKRELQIGLRKIDGRAVSCEFLTAFTDRRVTIYGEAGQPVDSSAGRRPADFEPIQLLCRAQTDHLARVVRRQVAAYAAFLSRALDAAGRPRQPRANRVAVAGSAGELQPNPVILAPGV